MLTALDCTYVSMDITILLGIWRSGCAVGAIAAEDHVARISSCKLENMKENMRATLKLGRKAGESWLKIVLRQAERYVYMGGGARETWA
jgi:hypothetical protein